MSRRQKEQIFALFEVYQSELKEVSPHDWPDLHEKVLHYLDSGTRPNKQYDAILVDEAQHFAPSWMRILRHFLKPEGELFLSDDPSQSVYRLYSTSAFVLELPPYRQPALKSVLIHMWENTREFVRKAGTLILFTSVIMWVLLNLPWGVTDQRQSYFVRFSRAISPLFVPLGFGNCETGGALVAGFMAKEIVVSTMSQIYLGGEEAQVIQPRTLGADLIGIGQGFVDATVSSGRILLSIIPGVNLVDEGSENEDTTLSLALREHFTSLSAAALLVFVLLYVPCVATLGAIKHEFGTYWAVTSAVYQTAVAWIAAFIVYQGGMLLGLG